MLRSAERRYVRVGALSMWKSFGPGHATEPPRRGFRSLESLNEVSLPPGGSVDPVPADRGAWLQLVAGRVKLLDESLESGDGAAFEGEAAVSFTTQEASEILLFEFA